MGKCIVKLAEDKYVEWSSVCDAPVTYIMDKESMEDYVRGVEEHSLGYQALEKAEGRAKELMLELVQLKVSDRLERIEKNGTSSMMGDRSAKEFVRGNRAGPKETELTIEQLIEAYSYKIGDKVPQ